MTEQKRIEAYSISEFAEKIQQGVLEGYRLDLESNENYPVQLGVVFICGMVLSEYVETVHVPQATVNDFLRAEKEGKEVFHPSVLEFVISTGTSSMAGTTNDISETSSKPAVKPGRPSKK